VSATNSEQASANTTTSASVWNSCPLVVRMNTTGRKMTQVVSVDAMTAPVTSRVPTLAASTRERPSCLCRAMFSSTTMALSTMSPMPRARPPKVIWFSVSPEKKSRPKVAVIEIGIASAMIVVVEPLRRNT
jgi:hypothetical protein